MKAYTFIKNGKDWYIDLPEYLEQGGSFGDLQMVDGADKMLDMMADGKEAITILVGREKFGNADLLQLVERCEPEIGGGYYVMEQYEGATINHTMWLCQVTEFVFNHLPEQIFVKRAPVSTP